MRPTATAAAAREAALLLAVRYYPDRPGALLDPLLSFLRYDCLLRAVLVVQRRARLMLTRRADALFRAELAELLADALGEDDDADDDPMNGGGDDDDLDESDDEGDVPMDGTEDGNDDGEAPSPLTGAERLLMIPLSDPFLCPLTPDGTSTMLLHVTLSSAVYDLSLIQ